LCTFVFKSGENLGDFDLDLKEKNKKVDVLLSFSLGSTV
jgi:hypothetical protein